MITLNKTSFYNLFTYWNLNDELAKWKSLPFNPLVYLIIVCQKHYSSSVLFIQNFIFITYNTLFYLCLFCLVANLFSYNPQRDTLSPSIFDKPSGRLLKGQEDYPYILVPFSHFILCKQSNIHKIILIIFVAFLLREMCLKNMKTKLYFDWNWPSILVMYITKSFAYVK